jgi:hypothetical protein
MLVGYDYAIYVNGVDVVLLHFILYFYATQTDIHQKTSIACSNVIAIPTASAEQRAKFHIC